MKTPANWILLTFGLSTAMGLTTGCGAPEAEFQANESTLVFTGDSIPTRPVLVAPPQASSISRKTAHLANELVILQTNDRHSHFLGIPEYDYDPKVLHDGTQGGIARMGAVVRRHRNKHRNVLLLSAGDFSMGTMMTGAQNYGADLNLLKDMGYQAAALGNHEFDFGPDTVPMMIQAARFPVVPLLCANIHFSDGPEDDNLQAIYGPHGQPGKFVHPYLVHTTDSGIRVGIFGLMGLDAGAMSFAGGIQFSSDMDDLAKTAQDVVDTLRRDLDVDVVVALAHLGLQIDNGRPTGETAELARRVHGIDVILSGHEHSVAGPFRIPCLKRGVRWSTVVMEAGRYGQYLGRYLIQIHPFWKKIMAGMVSLADNIPGAVDWIAYEQTVIEDTRNDVLSAFPQIPEQGAFLDGDYFQVLTPSDFDVIKRNNENSNLTNLVADAMRQATGSAVAVVSAGHDTRCSLERVGAGFFDLADTFQVTPLGIGPAGTLGTPLVRVYLSLAELFGALDATTCYAGLALSDFMLGLSGMRIRCNPANPEGQRILFMEQYSQLDESDAGVTLFDASTIGFTVDPFSTLVSVAMTLDVAMQMASMGITPRDVSGQPLPSIFDALVFDENGGEVKLWYALAGLLAGYSGGCPAMYNDDPSANPIGPPWRRARDVTQHPL